VGGPGPPPPHDAAREALERFHALEPKENPRADLMAKARQ
jgi:molecular chaperone DnaJ